MKWPLCLSLALAGFPFTWVWAQSETVQFAWETVVNNGDLMPSALCNPNAPTIPPCRRFNSYNPPSINVDRLVVFRARSRGGSGMGVHGVYTRNMADGGPLVKVLDNNTPVPPPNNLGTEFVEPPSFPRIDLQSGSVISRGNHPPVWQAEVPEGEEEERLGTSGVYANPFGPLVGAVTKLGRLPDFAFFEVPEAPGVGFDVFPGAPAICDIATVVFKGNYTLGATQYTGVYFRRLRDLPIPLGDGSLEPGGGTDPIVLLANNRSTRMPGTTTVFGSVAPPSAAMGLAVFAGFDDEDAQNLGGIYLTRLDTRGPPALTPLVSIGTAIRSAKQRITISRLGEGVSFDGRFAAFWGAWGEATKTVRLYCPREGNADRIAYCNQTLELEPGVLVGDPLSICDDMNDPFFGVSCYQEREVPVTQGIFVADRLLRTAAGTYLVASTGERFDDFLFWTYSGRVPGVGESGEDDGEAVRWRSSAFVAVSGRAGAGDADAMFQVAFKARAGILDPTTHVYAAPTDGIYVATGPGARPLMTAVESGMPGTILDSEAVDGWGTPLPISEMGVERDGFRGRNLVITARMGGHDEEEGWAGVYVATVPIAQAPPDHPRRK